MPPLEKPESSNDTQMATTTVEIPNPKKTTSADHFQMPDTRIMNTFSLFDLPREVRNKVYRFAVVANISIPIEYRSGDTSFEMIRKTNCAYYGRKHPKVDHEAREKTRMLTPMSMASEQLREEVRQEFYASNRLEFQAYGPCGTAYPQSYTEILAKIGTDGRSVMRTLICETSERDIHLATSKPTTPVSLDCCTSVASYLISMYMYTCPASKCSIRAWANILRAG
jgi:hypothetical protein